MEKIIIVGAGLSGATIARLFAERGYDVTIVDKRDNVGGNLYDYVNEDGIRIQPYGRHVFHTNDEIVFEFLSKFTEWTKYEHKVLARVRKDKFVPVPFNLNSLYALYPDATAKQIESELKKGMGDGEEASILSLKDHPSGDIRGFADFVYKNIFYIYTLKQWGFKPELLGDDVIARVPVRCSRDDRSFPDKYQFMPKKGFSEMIINLLRHPRIKLKIKTDAKKILQFHDGEIYLNGSPFDGKVVYTGCLDELFGYKKGRLQYRSLKFKFEKKKCSSYQRTAVVNYTTSHKYTRIIEFSKFTCEPKDTTVIAKEYPIPFKRGKTIPYYPVPTKKNKALYGEYVEEAKVYKNLFLLGRLAKYSNLNMGKAVKDAMELFAEIAEEQVDLDFIKEIKGI